MKTDNSSIERVEEFKYEYLGTTLTNKNSIQKEIKSRLKLGNACYYSVKNLLSSSLLSKELKIKIYRTIILPVVLYGCETWSLQCATDLEHLYRIYSIPTHDKHQWLLLQFTVLLMMDAKGARNI